MRIFLISFLLGIKANIIKPFSWGKDGYNSIWGAMNMLQFTEELLTGVPEMDLQHKTLVDLLNQVYQLLMDGDRASAQKLFKEKLLDYVETHLSEEEKFMESIGYPELEAHKRLHETFRKEIIRLAPAIEEGSKKAFEQALALSWGWLYTHITKADKKYGAFAKEKGLI